MLKEHSAVANLPIRELFTHSGSQSVSLLVPSKVVMSPSMCGFGLIIVEVNILKATLNTMTLFALCL